MFSALLHSQEPLTRTLSHPSSYRHDMLHERLHIGIMQRKASTAADHTGPP